MAVPRRARLFVLDAKQFCLVTAGRISFDRDARVWPRCGSVLISVSGGSDSVALLRVLIELNSQLRWDLAAVHFNHGFRRESEEEEVFVRSL